MYAAWHRIFLGDPVVAFNFHYNHIKCMGLLQKLFPAM